MNTPIIIQKAGQQMESAIILNWLVEEGDDVESGDSLFEMETDKTTIVVDAPESGIIINITAEEGDDIPVGEKVAEITKEKRENIRINDNNLKEDNSSEETEVESEVEKELTDKNPIPLSTVKKIEEKPINRIKASPYARKLAKEHSINLQEVKGSKNNQRIVAADIEDHIKGSKNINTSEIPITPMRKAIMDTVETSAKTVVPVTITMQINMDKTFQLRSELKEEGYDVSPSDFIISSVARALEKYKVFNSFIDREVITIFPNIDIGYAVALENGLLVPVLSNCNDKSLIEIAKDKKDIVRMTKEGKYRSTKQSTFTISSLGELGVESFSPVIYPNQAAILGVGNIHRFPVEGDKEIKFINAMKLSVVFDHRITDGAPAAEFMNEIKSYLESPLKLLV